MALKPAIVPTVPQLNAAVARLLPAATTAAAAVFSVQPVHLAGYANLTPAYTLMAVYQWTVYRPALLPRLAVFLIGVGFDLFSGGPPGVTPLMLLLARGLVLRQRRVFMNRPFPVVLFILSFSVPLANLFRRLPFGMQHHLLIHPHQHMMRLNGRLYFRRYAIQIRLLFVPRLEIKHRI